MFRSCKRYDIRIGNIIWLFVFFMASFYYEVAFDYSTYIWLKFNETKIVLR